MTVAKQVIIPIGFNATQCKEGIIKQMPSSFACKWMESADFVRDYLYCADDGPYDPPIEVWLLVCDLPSNMVRKPHANQGMTSCANSWVGVIAMGANLVWCKSHHANIRRHLIYIIPPRLNSKLCGFPVKAFLGVDDIHVIDMQDEISKADSNAPLLEFLERVDHRVVEIITGRKCTFNYCDTLVMYKIPDTTTYIEDRAFASCQNLREVIIPKTVERIGVNPFLRCRNLHVDNYSQHFVVENNMLIDREKSRLISFWGSDAEVELPATVNEIGDWAFAGCAYLQKLILPATLTQIGKNAFKGCRKLQSLQFPDSLLSIGEWAFYQCESFEKIRIPESVTSIGDWAFCCCKKLRMVHLPSRVTLGKHVFVSCEKLEKK